jgi:hypothetical protein
MKMGIELYAETSLSVDDTTQFELYLTRDGQALGDSRGSDRYLLNGMVILGKRVAASGREATYGSNDLPAGLGLGPLEARPTVACDVADEYRELLLHIVTTAVLDPALLAREFSVRIVRPDRPVAVDAPLCRPDVRINWVERGHFTVDLVPLLT